MPTVVASLSEKDQLDESSWPYNFTTSLRFPDLEVAVITCEGSTARPVFCLSFRTDIKRPRCVEARTML